MPQECETKSRAQNSVDRQGGEQDFILERAYNYMLSTQRIYVEHHFARVQKYQCLAQLWRGKCDSREDVFCVVAGLVNFRQTGHIELAG